MPVTNVAGRVELPGGGGGGAMTAGMDLDGIVIGGFRADAGMEKAPVASYSYLTECCPLATRPASILS